MGTRESEQSALWIATSELPMSPGHPFYARLNALLDAHDFDRFVEGRLAAVLATLCVLISGARRWLTGTVAPHRRIAVMRGRPKSPIALVVNLSAIAT